MYKPGISEHAGYALCPNNHCYKFGWVTDVMAKDDGLDSPVWVLKTYCCGAEVNEDKIRQREDEVE